MKTFEFSTEVVNNVVKALGEAEEYIRIAIFQLHHADVFSALTSKLKEGVRVEIFTLPYDSINDDIRDEVVQRFQNLEKAGAKLYFCKWNVGDPERTSTAVGRWYSFHGKFIVTDKSAIALSANFTQSHELDAMISFKGEKAKIDEYNAQFDTLVNLFITNRSGYEGHIRQKIIDTGVQDIESIFSLPRVIEDSTHKNHWIQHYPKALCPEEVPIENRLYLTPFDCRGRNFLMALISEAEKFVYLSTESFTDPEFPKFLQTIRLKGIDVRIITGITSMDFTDRIQNAFRDLLAHGIQLRTVEERLHAKLVITDKHLAVGSVNLNRMNLGFRKTQRFWRENTESIAVCTDPEILTEARSDYLRVFDEGIEIESKLAEKIQSNVRDVLSMFGLRSRQEVKELFAVFIIKKELEVRKIVLEVGKIASKLAQYFGKTMISKEEFLLSLTLYHLSERKQDFDQLHENLSILGTHVDLNHLLTKLIDNNFVEKVGDFYKIKLETLNP